MKKFLLWTLLVAFMGGSCSPSVSDAHTLGRDASWFPLQLDSKTAPLTAFTTALVQEIARVTHYPLEILNVDWVQLFQNLEEGHVAGVFSSLPPGLLSEKKYTFSDPIVSLGPVLIVPASSKFTSLLDLSGKMVAIYQYDESILVAQEYPAILIELYQSMPTILEDLKAGVIDAVLMPALEARSLVNHAFPGQLQIVSEPLSAKAIRLITCKNKHRSLIRHFNKGLQKTRDNGTYDKLRDLYHLD